MNTHQLVTIVTLLPALLMLPELQSTDGQTTNTSRAGLESAMSARDTASMQTPSAATVNSNGYDPLVVAAEEIKTIEMTFEDTNRSRKIPLLLYLPNSKQPAAVIVHSHGLGGTRNTSPFLGKHWAGRGYVCVFVQHPGSDDSVWKDVRTTQILAAMKQAASGKNLNLRTGDIHAVIDQLEKWNVEPSHPLQGRLNLNQVGMSGHSFGAVTTQSVAGQASISLQHGTDNRIRAAIPMSPSLPRAGNAKRALANVSIPWLCMTGTKDISKIGGADLDSRLGVFPALPTGDKYELVLFKAEHSVFTEGAIRRNQSPRNPNHHRAIKAISTAFWDGHLREDQAAKNWLKTDAVRSVLQTEDRWQTK